MPRRRINKNWVQQRLAQLGKTQRELAEAMGMHPSGMTELLNGGRDLSAAEAEAGADFLGIELSQLLIVFGIRDARKPYGRLAITGYIDASSGTVTLRADVDPGTLEYIDAPFPGYLGMVARIKGDSMSPRYRDGEAVAYTPDGHDPSRLIGLDVVAELDDGRRVLKTLHRGSDPDTYTLVSINPIDQPILNVRLNWAAPVDWHLPRRV